MTLQPSCEGYNTLILLAYNSKVCGMIQKYGTACMDFFKKHWLKALLGLVTLVPFIWALWLFFSTPIANNQTNYHQALATLIGGLSTASSVGIGFLTVLSNKETKEKEEKATREKEQKVATEAKEKEARAERSALYQKGVELLANTTTDGRMGGLFLLEQLLKEHPDEMGKRVVMTLAGFINNRAQYASKTDPESYFHPKRRTKNQALTEGFTPSHPPYEDIKLAFQILAERSLPRNIEETLRFNFPDIDHGLFRETSVRHPRESTILWNLYQVYTGSSTWKNTPNAEWRSYVGSDLAFFKELREAQLLGANLTNATLECSDLSKACLTFANLTDTNLSGTSLYGADLGAVYEIVSGSREDLTPEQLFNAGIMYDEETTFSHNQHYDPTTDKMIPREGKK